MHIVCLREMDGIIPEMKESLFCLCLGKLVIMCITFGCSKHYRPIRKKITLDRLLQINRFMSRRCETFFLIIMYSNLDAVGLFHEVVVHWPIKHFMLILLSHLNIS